MASYKYILHLMPFLALQINQLYWTIILAMQTDRTKRIFSPERTKTLASQSFHPGALKLYWVKIIILYLHRLSIFSVNCTENGECVMTA